MSLYIPLSRLIVLATTLVLIGCAPAQLMPQFDDTTLRTKQRDISTQQKRLPRQITEDPSTTLSRIYDRLEPSATRLCIENGEKWLDNSCSNWRVEVVKDENFNAYATSNRKIVFTTEVFKYTRSDDELAFILGHELGHHILNHLMEDRMNAEITGAAVGIFSAILTGAIAGALGADEETTSDVMADSMEDGWESGRESGRLTYSIDQESEADKLALQLIALSGYSESEARNIMLHIHGNSEGAELRSAHQASHPTGPERLAAFDLYASLTPNRPYTASKSSSTPLPRTAKETYPTGHVRGITSTPTPDQDIYEIAELGLSVRSYYGQLSATINQNFTGSHQVSNKGGVVVVAVNSGGKASRLNIKQGDRIVSYTKKGLGFGSVVINNSQELKTIAQQNGSKHFRNFYIIRNGSRITECAKLGMFSC